MHFLANYCNLSLKGEGAKISAILEKKVIFFQNDTPFSDSVINIKLPFVGSWYDIKLSENTKFILIETFFQTLEPKMQRRG